MSENMSIYNAVRSVPNEAIKPISAGRLKGFSDINPMWRIKKLTEMFGPCGVAGGMKSPTSESLMTTSHSSARFSLTFFYFTSIQKPALRLTESPERAAAPLSLRKRTGRTYPMSASRWLSRTPSPLLLRRSALRQTFITPKTEASIPRRVKRQITPPRRLRQSPQISSLVGMPIFR